MLRLDSFRYDNGGYSRFVARRDLSALIELYEANYVRLMNLAPDLETMSPDRDRSGFRSRDGAAHAGPAAGHDAHRAHATDPLGRFTLVSRVAGAMDLHLTIIERHRYTTTANLSYLFHDSKRISSAVSSPDRSAGNAERPVAIDEESAVLGSPGPELSGPESASQHRATDADDTEALLEPNARVCIYHDVRAVELVSHYRRRRSHRMKVMRHGRLPEVERRWQANRFLGKWLKFCLHQGHLFLAGVSTRSDYVDDMVRNGRGQAVRQTTV